MYETDICKSFVEWMRVIHPGVLFWHTANERKCSPQRGLELKRLGVLGGVADYCILSPNKAGDKHLLMLEVKTPKGRLSASQRAFADRLPSSVHFVCAKGLDECIKAVNDYLNG